MIFVLLLLYKGNDQKNFKVEIFLSTIFFILLKNISIINPFDEILQWFSLSIE